MFIRYALSIFCTVLFVGLTPSSAQDGKSSGDQPLANYRALPDVKPKNREVAFYTQRAYPFQRIPRTGIFNAIAQEKSIVSKLGSDELLAAQPEWSCIGPFRVGGRIRGIAVHPQNADIVYIAAAAGGIWKTEDGGETWTPIFDFENVLAFGTLAMDPNNPDVLYAGTGEMSTNIDAYFGNGIYKTTDAGATWKPIGLTSVGAFARIFVHPLNSNLVYAAATRNGGGLYKSTDAGENWERVFDRSVTDMTLNPQSEDSFLIGVNDDGLYATTDGGKTWEVRDFLNGLPANAIGRSSLSQSPSNPAIIYTLMEVDTSTIRGNGNFEDLPHCEIFKSVDGGRNWQQVYRDAGRRGNDGQWEYPFLAEQGWYNQYIAVHPTNPDIVLAGGIDVWRTENGGTTWLNMTRGYSGGPIRGGDFVHVDNHFAMFAPSQPDKVYIANDGGIFSSVNSGESYKNLNNNLAITQFYGIGIDQVSTGRTFGGTQDNNLRGLLNGQSWQSLGAGDGGRAVVDRINPDLIYSQDLASGALLRIDLGGQSRWINNGIDLSSRGYWVCPIVSDPSEPDILYHGRSIIYISFDQGLLWEPLSTDFPQLREQVDITAIFPSRVSSDVLYFGTEVGDVYVSRDLGESWEQVNNNGLVNRFVTDIQTSYVNEAVAYITFSGYGSGHVFRTDNYGQSWTDISQTLPDVPTNTIEVDPNNEQTLYVGTDIGVYATYDGGQTWFPFGRNLPRSPVIDLEIYEDANVLRAGTHGRSVWEVALPTEVVDEHAITSPAGGELYTPSSKQRVSWFGFEGAVRVEFSHDDGANWSVLHDAVDGNSLEWIVPPVLTVRARIRVTSNSNPSQQLVTNTFSINQLITGAVVQQESVGHVPYGIAYDGEGGLWTTSFYGKRLYKLNAETLIIERFFEMPEGDSLFTGITIDKEKKHLYVQRMNSTNGDGGWIYQMDYDGNLINTYLSRAKAYPIGLAWIGNNTIVITDRNTRDIYYFDLAEQSIIAQARNPFEKRFGPRGLCFDSESRTLYQANTDFTGDQLQGSFNVAYELDNLGAEINRFELNSRTGSINARGIEFDSRDKSFWISDFGGNIYKVAGFEVPDISVGVEEGVARVTPAAPAIVLAPARPNPFSEFTSLDFQLQRRADVEINVYDVSGNLVTRVHSGIMPEGSHTMQLDGSHLPSGVYSVTYRVDGHTVAAQNLVLMK